MAWNAQTNRPNAYVANTLYNPNSSKRLLKGTLHISQPTLIQFYIALGHKQKGQVIADL